MTDIAERLAKEAKQLRGGLARSINQFDSLWLQEAADTIATLRKELAEAVAAHNELVEELRQAHNTYGDMLAEARNKALHDAAVVGYRVCAQTRHVKLGDAVADEIRSLKDTTHDKA